VRNEVLASLEPLVGTWDLTLTNSWFLESMETRVSGEATFEWLDDAFIVWRWWAGDRDEPAVMVIGRSDARDEFSVLSWDSRGVSRVFGMTWGDGVWAVSREDPDFHQRFEATVGPDRIDMRVEASDDAGQTWRKDFDLIFERRTVG
jgi:hypothetical protein